MRTNRQILDAHAASVERTRIRKAQAPLFIRLKRIIREIKASTKPAERVDYIKHPDQEGR